MRLGKRGRKWVTEGEGQGWIFQKAFGAKWEAELAVQVFKDGGKCSDYWCAARQQRLRRPSRIPYRALAAVDRALAKIKQLRPTCDEILAYAEHAGHGIVTFTGAKRYFPPRLHNTWGMKWGGRVHIGLGCCGCHLMLDKHYAPRFIEFIEKARSRGNRPPCP